MLVHLMAGDRLRLLGCHRLPLLLDVLPVVDRAATHWTHRQPDGTSKADFLMAAGVELDVALLRVADLAQLVVVQLVGGVSTVRGPGHAGTGPLALCHALGTLLQRDVVACRELVHALVTRGLKFEGFGAKIEATLLEGAEAEGRVKGQPVAHADKGARAQLPAELSVERERHDPVLRVEEAADHIASLPSPLLAPTRCRCGCVPGLPAAPVVGIGEEVVADARALLHPPPASHR